MQVDRQPIMVKIDGVTFAKRLREARLAAKLTQQQLAEACGITDKAVSAWETGAAEGILAENLFCVADKLGIDARWLATGQASPVAVAEEMARDLSSLSYEQQEAVRQLVKSLKP